MPFKQLSRIQQAYSTGQRVKKDYRQSARSRGYDGAWQKLRLFFLREHPQCVFCDRPATIVDHVTPLNSGGARLDRANLRSVCRDHHDELTANYRATGRNELRKKRDEKRTLIFDSKTHKKVAFLA